MRHISACSFIFISWKLTVSIESVRVSVVERLGGRQSRSSGVSVSEIISSRAVDTWRMSFLVQNSCCLILAVASACKGGKLVEEERAVGDEVLGRNGVGKHIR